MTGLLVVERFVLETIGSNRFTIEQIKEKTNLNFLYLENILEELLNREILDIKESEYLISEVKKKSVFTELNKQENVKVELKELFSSFVNEFYQNHKTTADLKVKKVNLDEFEEKLLKVHLNNLSKFIKEVSKKKKHQISEQRVIVWGECNYLNLVNQSLEAV